MRSPPVASDSPPGQNEQDSDCDIFARVEKQAQIERHQNGFIFRAFEADEPVDCPLPAEKAERAALISNKSLGGKEPKMKKQLKLFCLFGDFGPVWNHWDIE
jgi:hypothetical protein